jgi:hypothetical protein
MRGMRPTDRAYRLAWLGMAILWAFAIYLNWGW